MEFTLSLVAMMVGWCTGILIDKAWQYRNGDYDERV